MSGLTGNNILGGSSGQATGYDIEKSVVLDTNSYFTRTPSSAGNRKTYTLSFWAKLSQGSNGIGFGQYSDSNNRVYFRVQPAGFSVYSVSGGSADCDVSGPLVFRDPFAWYHIVIVVDTTESTASNRIKLWVNGSSITLTHTTSWTQNTDTRINDTNEHTLGLYNNTAYPDGYLAEVNFIDGQALTPASFGETDADTNQWKAIEYEGSYGTNGFYLDFATRATDPIDASGNGNNWSSTNVIAGDWKIDSPTNNFATMNPLDPFHAGSSTFSEGNLKVSEAGGNAKYTQVGNFGMSSGKWYFEFCGVNSDNTWMLGIGDVTKGLSRGYTGTSGDGLFVYVDGDKYSPTSSSSYGVSWTHGDVMGIAVDMDNNAMYFAKNNTWMNSGVPTSGSTKTGAAYTTELVGKTWVAAMGRGSTANTITGTFNFGQDSSFAGAKTAQGNGGVGEDFYYTPPSGFKALNTNNLSDPGITDPTKHFNTILWTSTSADGTSALGAVTGVGFQPDLVWAKGRTAAWDHNLFNSVMGTGLGKALYTNTNFAAGAYDTSGYGNVTSFDSDGFTVGLTAGNNYAYNYGSGAKYLAWNWKAGGTAVSNTDGTITSSVSANPTAGFSIVSWTGTGSNVTVGHGLSQAPELIINKSRGDAYNWAVQSLLWNSASDTNMLYLNTTAGTADDTNVFQAAPTSTVFSPQGGAWAGIGTNTIQYIAYCFHSVDGYSKVGKYAGNGAQDGAFVYTGFRPAFIFIKRITNSGSNSYIVDNKRIGYNNFIYSTDVGSNKYLWPDASTSESAGNDTKGIGMDILSNGFKFRTDGGDYNASSNDYLFYAIAESPFKYSNAR
jgi:hypothetical protein